MGFRSIGVAGLSCLMLAGCATKQYASYYASRAVAAIERTFEDQNYDRLWQEQLKRQQQIARDAGRIGYIGYQGPALGTSCGSTGSFCQ